MTQTRNGAPSRGAVPNPMCERIHIIPGPTSPDKSISDFSEPDWAHRFVAENPGERLGDITRRCHRLAAALYAHPNEQRGLALVDVLYDALQAHVADDVWRLRYPDGISPTLVSMRTRSSR